jgi:hypothetical protein
MSDTITELMFLNKDKTIIQAKRNNTFITIEQAYDVYNLFDAAISGDFGDIDETYINSLTNEEYKQDITISALQAKAILAQYDLLQAVEDIIAEQDFIVQLAWREANEFKLSSNMIQSLMPLVKWPDGEDITEQEWFDLFIEASNLSF